MVALCACALPAGRANAGDEVKKEAIHLARATLAETLRAEESHIETLSAKAVEWRGDRSECRPATDEGEPPITSGYEVKLMLGGTTFTVHVGGGKAKICSLKPVAPAALEDRIDSALADRVDSGLADRVEVAKLDLAERLEVSLKSIHLLEAMTVTWRDSSAGCPRPGMNYLQVLNPGVRILLQAAKKTYHYHGRGGGVPFLCERPRKDGFTLSEAE